MIDFKIVGAIFDVDDTLLDNMEHTGEGLHERSRLRAVREVGLARGIKSLAEYSAETNKTAFKRSSVHTLEGALWRILIDAGITSDETVDIDNELIKDIAKFRHDLHEVILREEGEPIANAPEFVKALVKQGVEVAIASSSILSHINIFLDKVELSDYFPASRIKSFESFTNPKPHPEIFNLAFASLGLAEKERVHTLAFEDDPRGVTSANEAGLFTCALTSRFPEDVFLAMESPPNLIANSYLEFAALLGVEL